MFPISSTRCMRVVLAAALVTAIGPVAAQIDGRSSALPDPLDPQAAVPELNYRSALETYRRFVDDPPIPWREANETVNRIGGWRAYAREASQPETKQSDTKPTDPGRSDAKPASLAAPPVSPGAHHGHNRH